MKRALGKYLPVKWEYLRDILRGRKTATIRWGLLTVPHKRVYLECGGRVYGELEILGVKHVKLSELSDEDARQDGFYGLTELIAALTRIYPDITPGDWVTVIRFRLVARYPTPVTRQELESELSAEEARELSREVLARGLVRSRDEYKMLLMLSKGLSFEEVAEALGPNYTPAYVKALISRVARRLSRYGYR